MSPLNVGLTRCGVEVEINRRTVREIGVASRDGERAWYVNFTPKRRRMAPYTCAADIRCCTITRQQARGQGKEKGEGEGGASNIGTSHHLTRTPAQPHPLVTTQLATQHRTLSTKEEAFKEGSHVTPTLTVGARVWFCCKATRVKSILQD